MGEKLNVVRYEWYHSQEECAVRCDALQLRRNLRTLLKIAYALREEEYGFVAGASSEKDSLYKTKQLYIPEDGKNVLRPTHENLTSQYPSRCREIIYKCVKRAVLTEVVSMANSLGVQ